MLFLSGIASCTPSIGTKNPTPITVPDSDPLPSFLREVRPPPSSSINELDFLRLIKEEGNVFGGPPPPAVEVTGYRSSVCVDLDVESLVEPGDSLVFDEDVLPRTKMVVDDKLLTDRADTEYLIVIEPGPDCRCFYDCESFDGSEWYVDYVSPENIGCWFWPGFWSCYSVDLEPGLHTATFSFEKSSGNVAEYSWYFTITE